VTGSCEKFDFREIVDLAIPKKLRLDARQAISSTSADIFGQPIVRGNQIFHSFQTERILTEASQTVSCQDQKQAHTPAAGSPRSKATSTRPFDFARSLTSVPSVAVLTFQH
jgi:hypothetical protein